jgi:hypothetical protein
MKKVSLVLRFALAFCVGAVAFSCDKTDDVTFGVTLTHTFHVNQVAAGDDIIYELEEILDAASSDPEFNKYKKSITNVSVNSVTYTMQNVTTAGVLFTGGTIAYSSIIASEPDPTFAVANIGVENVKAAENQEKNLQFNPVALNDMSSLLKNNKELNVYLKGTLSTSPAKFDVLLTINATVTANTL